MLGTSISATEALRVGVVNHVAPDEAALTHTTDRIVAALLEKPRETLHMIKQQFIALAQRSRMGDVTLSDGDLLVQQPPAARAKL